LIRKPEGKTPLEDLGIDGRIILERILKKQVGRVWSGSIWLRMWNNGGFL
jgi:hypothetical protein